MFTTESIYGENGGGGDDATDVQTGRTVTTDGTHFCFPPLSPKQQENFSTTQRKTNLCQVGADPHSLALPIVAVRTRSKQERRPVVFVILRLSINVGNYIRNQNLEA